MSVLKSRLSKHSPMGYGVEVGSGRGEGSIRICGFFVFKFGSLECGIWGE